MSQLLLCRPSPPSCQNWEGGLSGVPGLEAHGGYTFCGTAALVILGTEHMLDLKALLVRKTSRMNPVFSGAVASLQRSELGF